ncbi:hypothetical protein NA56DRAFT_710714 [Hyaloscypha hepaticicola]|uniref:Uncharacterized protein n=1 Tax=Hyaloscypha hepaticicola TaxID=2082293 RepID=A0A2J6PKU2_9HELO|nr:hypothetical protein NA56DRAFT_710714 [Hyaloscypha hepaticicola]
MGWKMETLGGQRRCDSRQEGARRQDNNNTSTRHSTIKSISGIKDGEKVSIDLSTVYWSNTQPIEKARFMSSRKSTGGYLKHHAVSTHQSHRTPNPRQRSQGSQKMFPLRHRPQPRMESRSSIHETPVRSYFATCDSAPLRDGQKEKQRPIEAHSVTTGLSRLQP